MECCDKFLVIEEIENEIRDLLEQYRQCLRAAELLPVVSSVPSTELKVNFAKPIGLLTKKDKKKFRNGFQDWVTYHLAIRFVARMFLRSHIKSKIRIIIKYLEIERFAGSQMGTSASKRLEQLIDELKTFERHFANTTSIWLKVGGGVWAIASPVLIAVLSTHFVPLTWTLIITIISYSFIWILFFTMFAWAPLYYFVGLGGFRWKRLILLGQLGDVNMDISAFARWSRAPVKNTYFSENQVFKILGLPKSTEFPWDVAFSPTTVFSAIIALSLLFAFIVILFSVPNPNIFVFIITFLLSMLFSLLVTSILRSIRKVRKDRITHGIC